VALFDMPMVPKNGTITIEDATGSPISMTVAYEEGDFQHGEVQAGYMDAEFIRDRGVDSSVVETGENVIEFSFSAYATDFGDNTEKTIPDVVMKTGAFSAGVSVFGANRPWGVKVTYTQEQTNYGAGADSSIVFAKVRLSYGFAEAGTGRFTIRGRIFNPSSTITRS
jgi:hypothetical protein